MQLRKDDFVFLRNFLFVSHSKLTKSKRAIGTVKRLEKKNLEPSITTKRVQHTIKSNEREERGPNLVKPDWKAGLQDNAVGKSKQNGPLFPVYFQVS